MKIECDACGREVDHRPTPGRNETAPSGWARRILKGRLVVVCDWCGGDAAFVGGLQPHVKARLRERYGLAIDDDDRDEGSPVP